jgi:EpsI family protein
MKSQRIKALIVLVLTVLAFAGARAWRPTVRLADARPKVNLQAIFPKTFSSWMIDERGPMQLISPDLQALLNKIYNQTLNRSYVNSSGDRIMLSVAYGGDQSDGTSAHMPEVCYPAQGFQLLSKKTSELMLGQKSFPVRNLVARLGSRVEPITYWTVIGDRIVLTGTEQKIAQLAYTTRGLIPDGVLVRISTIDTDPVRAYRTQAGFVEDLASALSAPDRVFVFGAGH